MAKAQKQSRKKLLKEPDEFYTLSARLFSYALEHKFQLLGALGGVILIVLIITGSRFYLHRQTQSAFTSLQTAWAAYESQKDSSDPVQAYPKVQQDFVQIIQNYSGRAGGKFARLVYANISLEAGDVDTAIENYEAALNDFDDPLLRALILQNLGYAYEKKKDYEAAAEYFEKMIGDDSSALSNDALFHLGRIYAKLGESEKSRDAYSRMLAGNRGSIYKEMVTEKVHKMEVR